MTDKTLNLLVFFTLFLLCNAYSGTPEITVCGKATVDVGSYPANRMAKAIFILKNQGDADLIIKRIRKTCGCSATRLKKKLLKPGEKTELTVSITPNSIRGPFNKSVYIENNTPDQRFFRLSMTGQAIAILRIHPQKNLYMGSLEIGKSYDFPFKLITSQNQVKVKIETAESNFPLKFTLRKNKQGFDLIIKASPDIVNNALHAKIMISILSPVNWPPLMINLKGRARNKQLPSETKTADDIEN